jgi:hypothetical protein
MLETGQGAMNEHEHEHEDETVCVKVAVFLVITLGVIFFLGMINTPV